MGRSSRIHDHCWKVSFVTFFLFFLLPKKWHSSLLVESRMRCKRGSFWICIVNIDYENSFVILCNFILSYFVTLLSTVFSSLTTLSKCIRCVLQWFAGLLRFLFVIVMKAEWKLHLKVSKAECDEYTILIGMLTQQSESNFLRILICGSTIWTSSLLDFLCTD